MVAPPNTPQFPPEVLLARILLVMVTGPSLKIAPPLPALLPEKGLFVTGDGLEWVMGVWPEKVLFITVSTPGKLLWMAPPLPALLPLAMVRLSTVNVTHGSTENTLTVPPPLMVITLPPRRIVKAPRGGDG